MRRLSPPFLRTLAAVKSSIVPHKSTSKLAVPDALQHRLSKIHVLTPAELERLFTVITDLRDRALFLVAYRHGLRASEVSLLRKTDVDLTETTIRIQRLTRTPSALHALQKDEALALRQYLKSRADPSVILFLGPRGRAITRRGLDWLIKQYGLEARIPSKKRHFHVLKHSIATHLLSAGVELREVHKWLGHTMLQNTAIYLYLVKPRARRELPFRRRPL